MLYITHIAKKLHQLLFSSFSRTQTGRHVWKWYQLCQHGWHASNRRLVSNLRLTTRKCVHLVRLGHFQTCDKDSGPTIWSTIVENPILHINFMALCFTEPELLPMEVLHCGNTDFWPFCSCDLDPMTFIYELDVYSLTIYPMCKYELPTSRLLKVIMRQTDRQTRPKLHTTPLRGWSKFKIILELHSEKPYTVKYDKNSNQR